MMRTKTPSSIETHVLLRCRRRCCICFGLNRDTKLKSGQIAHLDRNPSNATEDNLAFLCFDHHDEYDSRTSQRKQLTVDEVKRYRTELIEAVSTTFSQQVHFGELKTPPADPYAGQWLRVGSGEDSAELVFTPLPDTMELEARYFVSGLAFWGTWRPMGPNFGIIEFVGTFREPKRLVYSEDRAIEGAVTILDFVEPGMMQVTEENCAGEYGVGVTFEGFYRRA